MGLEGFYWISVVQDMDEWRDLTRTKYWKCGLLKRRGIFLL